MPSDEAKQGLSRYRRIGRKEGFRLESGYETVSNKWFVVYARENSTGISRLGIIVSKRVTPKATSRNYAKRLVREGFRRMFPVGRALNVVVRVRRQFSKPAANEISAALMQLLQGVQSKCGNC